MSGASVFIEVTRKALGAAELLGEEFVQEGYNRIEFQMSRIDSHELSGYLTDPHEFIRSCARREYERRKDNI